MQSSSQFETIYKHIRLKVWSRTKSLTHSWKL